MDGEPALAMTVAQRCRWANIKGDWYQMVVKPLFGDCDEIAGKPSLTAA
jgi:hypothetical protein